VRFSWGCLLEAIDPIDLLVSVVIDSIAMEDRNPYMPHKAFIVHAISGRVRLRVPDKRDDTAFFKEIAQRLLQCDNVTAVAVNAITASVLVRYTGSIIALIGQAYEAGLSQLVDIEMQPPKPQALSGRLLHRVRGIDRTIRNSSGGELDGSSAIVVFLLIAAGVQLFRGQVFGAIPLLWYASEAIGGVSPTALPVNGAAVPAVNRQVPNGPTHPIPTHPIQ